VTNLRGHPEPAAVRSPMKEAKAKTSREDSKKDEVRHIFPLRLINGLDSLFVAVQPSTTETSTSSE
jgi:hypothetical protein